MPPVIAHEQKTRVAHGVDHDLQRAVARARVNVAVGVGERPRARTVRDQLAEPDAARRRPARSPRGISPAAARTPAISISSSTTRWSGIARVLERDADHRDAAALAHHRHALAERGRRRPSTRAPPRRPRPPVSSRTASTGSLGGEVDRLVAELGRLREPRAAARPRSRGRRRARGRTRPPAGPSRPGPTTTTVSPGAWPPRLTVCSAIAAGSSIAASSSLSASGTAKTLRTECTT